MYILFFQCKNIPLSQSDVHPVGWSFNNYEWSIEGKISSHEVDRIKTPTISKPSSMIQTAPRTISQVTWTQQNREIARCIRQEIRCIPCVEHIPYHAVEIHRKCQNLSHQCQKDYHLESGSGWTLCFSTRATPSTPKQGNSRKKNHFVLEYVECQLRRVVKEPCEYIFRVITFDDRTKLGNGRESRREKMWKFGSNKALLYKGRTVWPPTTPNYGSSVVFYNYQ